jgi:hypothetical protein
MVKCNYLSGRDTSVVIKAVLIKQMPLRHKVDNPYGSSRKAAQEVR